MLPKKNRADRKVVDEVFKDGKFINSTFLTFKFIKRRKSNVFFAAKEESSLPLQKTLLLRLSVIVPKSVAKLAVKRNFLRRLGYKALEKHLKSFPPGTEGVFIFKKYQDDALIIENEIKAILSKIN